MHDKGEDVMSTEILENLKNAVAEYDVEGAQNWTKKAIEAGIDPVDAADGITEVLKQIGDGFSRGDLFLPDLVGGAAAMQAVMPMIQEEIERRGAKRRSLGTIAIGTVYGDIHDIGKTLVSALLAAAGFEVIDLGINVGVDEFVAAVEQHRPSILAMSALMTTTASEQRRVLETLEREGLRDGVRVMVGGGGITKEFAARIGADGYGSTAPEAVKLAKQLLSIE